MKTFLELAKARRSIRKYKAEPIDGKVLNRILDAARVAPSGNNAQPWRFIVVSDGAMKKKLFDVAGKQPWILDAPVAIAVIADMAAKIKPEIRPGPISVDDPKLSPVLIKAVRDATIAADHMVMAATDEGLGSCWIALFEQEDIRPVLGVPEHCYVIAIITLGYAAEAPQPSRRLPLEEIVFEGRYGRRRSVAAQL